jgi:hypothetical protein
MLYNVFYCIYEQDVSVDGKAPVQLPLEQVLEIARGVVAGEGNFIGFVDEAGTTLQFAPLDDGTIWMEIPAPSERGSYGKSIGQNEFFVLLSRLQEPYQQLVKWLGLEFSTW